jgi:prevent-host-death family protein
MTVSVNISDAVTQLSELIHQAIQGEDVVIAEAGMPIVRLVPIAPESLSRVPGQDKGKVFVADDFDDPLPENILAGFLDPSQP